MPGELRGVEATALLVNESRARLPELSRDPFALDWIPAGRREQVRELWAEFAEAVYPHDDLVCALRGRTVQTVLEAALADDPGTALLSIGAGFTSYPWSLPIEVSIEVDLPTVTEAKRDRARALTEAGVLPPRTVHHLAVDLATAGAPSRIRRAVEELVPAGRPVAVVIEGLLYYLPRARAVEVLRLPAVLEHPVAAVVASYWPTGAEAHPVLARQARWFTRRGVPTDATHLAPAEVAELLGGEVADEGPTEQQVRFGSTPMVPDERVIPERTAWTVP